MVLRQAATSATLTGVEGAVPNPTPIDLASNSSSSLSHHVNIHQVVSKSETITSDSSRQRIPSGSKVTAGQSLDLLIQVSLYVCAFVAEDSRFNELQSILTEVSR